MCQDMFVCSLKYFDGGSLIFIGFIMLIGLISIICGIRKTWRSIATNRKGVERIGVVVECLKKRGKGEGINDPHYYKFKVLLIDDMGNVCLCKEVSSVNYEVGSFLQVKHYKNDINILNSISADLISDIERQKLEKSYNEYLRMSKR